MNRNALLLASRLLLAALFVPSGFQVLTNLSGTIDYFTGLGLPLPTLAAWGTGLFELIAGLLILVGFQTRIAALLLAAFTIVAGFIGHFGQGGEDATLTFMHHQMLMKDIAIAGGFLALAMAGAGAWSADGRPFGVGAEIT
ncbi:MULTISPECIES: DoxX family protein [unclassified Mesorhizobium]|uniref:DoxX family protein n=1 Tax=unclassified Mesorhizobium TaxID=325217 RepID=UPI000F755FA1|nr:MULTISPECIES: DoxX family protein [unclassified Mesorhizobium]TGV92269.1 DoxX family protein [Mesorhizobium sp. M00.F.Ca.ET.158.01.1.1]AZO58306.1 DoxX family protein [Mesorhizobium sp. M1A.F.Ca.IN.022.06.1.1]MCT2579610.1 DoxX family protein [Mesorhizobium sp. P13.3]MDF3168214.1 DoxX family protein [Mesorhizobium sp. P16.1]MDF3177813.1 DoxX family protein [Mesorhizobium sp. P17.1]